MLNKQAEVKKRMKEDPFKLPWRHIMDVYGYNEKKAKEFHKAYLGGGRVKWIR